MRAKVAKILLSGGFRATAVLVSAVLSR